MHCRIDDTNCKKFVFSWGNDHISPTIPAMYGMVQLKTYLVCGSCGLGMRSLMMTTGCSRSNERLFVGRAGFTSLLGEEIHFKVNNFQRFSNTHFAHSHTLSHTQNWQNLAYFVLPQGYLSIWRPPLLSSCSLFSQNL